ncbi:hypothetical protein ANN_26683 [Periplaneta americana]|uniref:Uncharacterized protein n=1 Tax=Periplaneta americana TaxID=6978 RepID=A0ABQ8RYR7_PERAM|nr:hypothetical protein ANN_26683 [Periplaneta americana]
MARKPVNEKPDEFLITYWIPSSKKIASFHLQCGQHLIQTQNALQIVVKRFTVAYSYTQPFLFPNLALAARVLRQEYHIDNSKVRMKTRIRYKSLWTVYSSGRQHSLKCAKGKRCRPVCTVVQQEAVESIPASSYEYTMVHCVFRGVHYRLHKSSRCNNIFKPVKIRLTNNKIPSRDNKLFLIEPTTSNVTSEFNIDPCRSLISADIPLYRLKNECFREFLEKYTKHTTPDELTRTKTNASSIYHVHTRVE